ncbi:hypothetical protein AOY90_15765 [Escherichia coli]|nr:hypothetical protein [Escherichia coli]UMT46985.1 hypothetical protein AOY90_15765 [Escherichia coli]
MGANRFVSFGLCSISIFSFGKSNLMRLIAHYFKFGYSDKKLKRLDREWRDIQLFKTLNGINVSGIEDVRMIQQGLIDGKLKHRIFSLLASGET